MQGIKNIGNYTENYIGNYTGNYNTNLDYSILLGTSSRNEATVGFSLSDYASIKNGSYGKLLKAYYAKQDAEKRPETGDSAQRLMLMKSNADALKKSADALGSDSLWEKKKITKKDEITGEEKVSEDYDWKAITKAVKSFVDDYNSVVEGAGNSNTKNVLRNAAWMTNMTSKNENLLAKAGITIGKGNKLELDEDALKKTNISTLKSLFCGYNSFANKISYKAGSIGNAANGANAVSSANAIYTSSGIFTKTLDSIIESKLDEKV